MITYERKGGDKKCFLYENGKRITKRKIKKDTEILHIQKVGNKVISQKTITGRWFGIN